MNARALDETPTGESAVDVDLDPVPDAELLDADEPVDPEPAVMVELADSDVLLEAVTGDIGCVVDDASPDPVDVVADTAVGGTLDEVVAMTGDIGEPGGNVVLIPEGSESLG